MTINTSTRARITRSIFNAVTNRLIPAVVRLHHKSLTRIQDQQDQALKDARQAAHAALIAARDASDQADDIAAQRMSVMIALAEERRRISAYVKED